MKGRGALQIAGISAMVSMALSVALVASTPAEAVTLGSNLATAPNDSVCKFQSLEPETRICRVEQDDLLAEHTATGGLVAPFDGVIVSWSVVSGTALPGTGTVKLALRTESIFGDFRRGPEVELPSSPPGTTHTYPEQMSIVAGQPIGLTISTTNRNTQEAGAPIAFQGEGAGKISTLTGQPLKSIWNMEEDVELLLDAEIEPDADHDGLGDLTQDCFPTLLGRQELCGHDLVPPTIEPHFAARQPFLRSGTILIGVASTSRGWRALKVGYRSRGGVAGPTSCAVLVGRLQRKVRRSCACGRGSRR
jgi:hypothetical protein